MSRTTAKTRNLVQLSLLIALEAVMAFTPLGFIMIPPISITILHIPVIIGAIVLGPMAGGVLGGVFGLCSIWNNTMTPALLSFAFSPFIAAQELGAVGAVKSLWIVLGCRIMIGVVAGWLWIGLKKLKVNDLLALPVVGVAGALTNTGLVMGSIYFLLRPEYAAMKNIAIEMVLDVVLGVVGTSGVAEAVAAAVLVTAIGKALLHVPTLRPVAEH